MADDPILMTGALLMALLPRPFRQMAGGPSAILKWAGPGPLDVMRSRLAFLDAAGRLIETREDAFGIAAGAVIAAPFSRHLVDEDDVPAAAVMQRWSLNDWDLGTPARETRADELGIALVCLPLLVPAPEDVHLLASLVNAGPAPLDIAAGVREAVCWVDGKPWPSTAGGNWNGPYLLQPGRTATRRFQPRDFPGAPVTGPHEISLEMLGRRSPAQRVAWRGTAWTARNATP
jgi:hypothetical protein